MHSNIIMEFRRPDISQSLTAGTGFPDYKISKLEGITGLPFTFTTTVNPQVPGSEINNIRAEPRNIDIEIDCAKDLREHVISFFNPFFPGKLTLTLNGVTRWITYRPKPIKAVMKNVFSKITVGITLYCKDPYWKDMSDYGKDITFRQPLMAFPFVMLPDRGLIASYRIPSNAVTINNPGATPAPLRVLLQAYGDTHNPRIILNESKYIQVNVDMKNGDTLEISTDPKDIYVRLNGENVLNRTDRNSTYFQLPIGDSILGYQAGEEFDVLSVIVYYTPCYLGV